MRHLLADLLAVTLILVSACGGRSGPAGPAIPAVPGGPTIVFAVPATVDLDDVGEIVDARLQAAGLGRAEVRSRDPRLVACRLVTTVPAEDAQKVATWLGGRGELQFRIAVERAAAQMEAEKRELFADRYRLPVGWAWLPDASGGPGVFVEVPEQQAQAALAAAIDELAPEAEVAELREALQAILDSDVFGGDDVAEADMRQQRTESVLYFAMADDRKAVFEAFTKRHVKRQLAVVLDGRVHALPVIQTPLPGDGVISGGGGGFRPDEAALLAVILDQQLQLPVDLDLIRIDEPPPSEDESPR